MERLWSFGEQRWVRSPRDGDMRYVRHQGWLKPTRLPERSTPPFWGERRVPRAKPKYYWTWPKDGKNGSKSGRFKDILTGKGPDIHVSISGDKVLHPDDWPHRPNWSNWPENEDCSWFPDLDYALPDRRWANRDEKKYDFMKRRFVRPNPGMLSDAHWATEKSRSPSKFRDAYGGGWEGIPLGHGLYNYRSIGRNPFGIVDWINWGWA